MSKYVQVGMTAMRDPVTGELLESVPLYVDTEYEPAPVIPKEDMKLMARDLARHFRATVARMKKIDMEGNDDE